MRITGRKRRHQRVRKKIFGTRNIPRLSNIYAQAIDDISGQTLASASTFSPEIRSGVKKLKKTEAAEMVGKLVAKKAKEKNILKIIFDRGGYLYHGRVKRLAEGARKEGLKF